VWNVGGTGYFGCGTTSHDGRQVFDKYLFRETLHEIRTVCICSRSSHRRATLPRFGSILLPLFLLQFHLISRPSSLKPKLSVSVTTFSLRRIVQRILLMSARKDLRSTTTTTQLPKMSRGQMHRRYGASLGDHKTLKYNILRVF